MPRCAGRLLAAGLAAVALIAALSGHNGARFTVARAAVNEYPAGQAIRSAAQPIYHLLPFTGSAGDAPGTSAGPSAATFTFDKRVMLRADYDRDGCGLAKDSLTVYHGTLVAYCYIFTNIGSTTFLTHVMTDDKLGSTGTFQLTVPPGGQVGFAGLPPDGVTQDVTNVAVWSATDAAGTTLSRSDSVTVKVVIPLAGYVFIDENGDGIRQSGEKSGISNVTVTLNSRPATSGNQRQTKTAASGYYEFLDVVEGPSTVGIQLPAGYVATSATSLAVDLVFGVPKTVHFGARAATATPRPTPTLTAPPSLTATSTEPTTAPPTVTLTATVTPTIELTLTPSETPAATPSVTPEMMQTETPIATATASRLYLPALLHAGTATRPLAPSLMPITAPGANRTYVLSWTPIYGAASYEVERCANERFAPPVEPLFAGDRVSVEVLSSGVGVLHHRVRGLNAVGAGTWSQAQTAYVSWETEPNNAPAEANRVVSDDAVFALSDDLNDYFQFIARENGRVSARVEDITGANVRVTLYYEDIGNIRAIDTTAPYLVTANGAPGVYYVRVFVGDADSTAAPYKLTASFP